MRAIHCSGSSSSLWGGQQKPMGKVDRQSKMLRRCFARELVATTVNLAKVEQDKRRLTTLQLLPAAAKSESEWVFTHFRRLFIPLSIRDKVHFEIGNWLRLNLESTRPPTETVKNNENDFENKLKISIYTRRDTPSCEWNVTRCWTQFEKGNKTGQDRIPESQHYLAAQEEKGYKILIIK